MVVLQENKNYNIEDINENNDNNNYNGNDHLIIMMMMKITIFAIKYACKYVRRLQVLLIKRSAGQLMILYMP